MLCIFCYFKLDSSYNTNCQKIEKIEEEQEGDFYKRMIFLRFIISSIFQIVEVSDVAKVEKISAKLPNKQKKEEMFPLAFFNEGYSGLLES